jgi:hypothetical protein
VDLRARADNPATLPDEADMTIDISITDVRKQRNLSDYTGSLLERTTFRITDQNGGEAPVP